MKGGISLFIVCLHGESCFAKGLTNSIDGSIYERDGQYGKCLKSAPMHSCPHKEVMGIMQVASQVIIRHTIIPVFSSVMRFGLC